MPNLTPWNAQSRSLCTFHQVPLTLDPEGPSQRCPRSHTHPALSSWNHRIPFCVDSFLPTKPQSGLCIKACGFPHATLTRVLAAHLYDTQALSQSLRSRSCQSCPLWSSRPSPFQQSDLSLPSPFSVPSFLCPLGLVSQVVFTHSSA